MNNRLKELRKSLKLSQTDFGEKIGLKQSTIGQLESGTRVLTDRTIMLLVQSYNVSEDWLRNGGEDSDMFCAFSEANTLEFAREYGLGEESQAVLVAYCKMDEDKRKALHILLKELLVNVQTSFPVGEHEPKEEVPLAPLNPAIPEWDEFDVEEETERIRQELIEEKRAKAKSSASIERKQA